MRQRCLWRYSEFAENMPDHCGNRTYDLWNAWIQTKTLHYKHHFHLSFFQIITYSKRPDRINQLAEHWASIPKVVASIPTVVRHIF